MDTWKRPYIRSGLVVLVIIMLAWLPTREFLKLTFMVGIPFIFILGFMLKKERYSFPWVVSLVLLIGIVGGYGYLLTDLPERIETRRIISQGAGLMAEGKYDQAIKEYRKLEALGRTAKMNEKIETARKEKAAQEALTEAKRLIKAGKPEQAKKVLEAIPEDTRAGGEAEDLLD
ncbi:MAG: hypothetical protein ACM3PE_13320 [Deltaproteobacteria bacterium]